MHYNKYILSILLGCCAMWGQNTNAQLLLPNRQAHSVILIYLDGGPSQTDTFDPKPKMGRDYCGQYRKPIETNTPGVYIGERLPKLATIADKYTIIRSMTHGSNAHETGHYCMITGDMTQGALVYPSFGAVISYAYDSLYTGVLPSYISVTEASTRFNESGFLGPQYKSFDTGGAPEQPKFSVEGIVDRNISDETLRNKQKMLYTLDKLTNPIEPNDEVNKLSEYRTATYDLILGNARDAFDLSLESDSIRKRYGMHRLGQSCLLARRLVEQGVPVINVRFTGWDTHKEHFARMDERLGMLDQAVSALLEDLSKKGLLEKTIVLCGGEFGRTPKVMWEPPWNGGRGHFGDAFSYLVAGGGFAGGKVVGETDNKGEKVISRPVYPCDLIGSVYQLMGINPYAKVKHDILGEIPLLPSLKSQENSLGILTEIMK